MAKKYLDDTGLSTLWNIIKNALNLKLNTNGDAYRASSIPFGQVDSTSTSKNFTATVSGITELRDGVCMWLRNGKVTSASGYTININNLGAKPVYSSLASATQTTTVFNVDYTMLFIYNSTRVEGGCWDCVYGYDSNTNTTGYYLRTYTTSLPMSSKTYRYRLLFTSADGAHYVPANNSTSTNATATRTVCQEEINPFGPIKYYGTTAAVDPGARPSTSYLWDQNSVTLGYSFNNTGAALTLTSWKPVYIKCSPQASGSAIINSAEPYTQQLPSTEDGYIYIYLGIATSATAVELVPHHPIYYFYNGKIQLWTGIKAEENQNAFSNIKINSTVVSADSKTDTLELTAGNNITLTPDTTNDKITIAATDTTYSAGTGLSLSGTTFSNSGVTGIKGNGENSYRTGQVNLTPLDIGAVAKSDELQTTNPFAPNSLKGMYISKIDNGFYAADKRWVIDGLTAFEASVIFNGNYESKIIITKETSKTFTIDFENSEIDVSPYNNVNCMAGYPYGYILLSFYNASVPESVSGRIYCNYEPHGIGWHDISFIPASDNTANACVYRGRQSCYAISKLEITINAGANTNAELTQVEIHLDRPDSQRTPFLSKYAPETLYYNLTAPKFIGDVTASTVEATTKVSTPIVETGNTAPSYFQTERLRGEGNASTYYHAIDFGKSGHNQVDFYEYGGVFNFHKHTGATIDAGDTLLGAINNKGWDGKVNNHTVNADVPANAVFTDTTYSEATTATSGLMSATDKSHLDAIYNDYSTALTALLGGE